MAQEFDDTKLQSLSEKIGKFFDCVKLKADLIRLYSSQTIRNECITPAQLLSFLYQNDLIQTVPKATKLLKLVHTVPSTTVVPKLRSAGRIGPTKTFYRARGALTLSYSRIELCRKFWEKNSEITGRIEVKTLFFFRDHYDFGRKIAKSEVESK